LQALAGCPFSVDDFREHFCNLPFFFCDITLYPIVDAESLNKVLYDIENPYIRYIPNRLLPSDIFRLFNARTREQAAKALPRLSSKKLHRKINRAYNCLGYAIDPPDFWPQTWVRHSLKHYSLEQSIKFARIILGDLTLGDSKNQLIARIHNMLQAEAADLPACAFCKTRIGHLFRNQRCAHIPFYHMACLTNFIQTPEFNLECPVRGCRQRSYIFNNQIEIVSLEGPCEFDTFPCENLWKPCDVCGKGFALGEHYQRELLCRHVYHTECAYISPVSRRERLCSGESCRIRFTLDSQHLKAASYAERIVGR